MEKLIKPRKEIKNLKQSSDYSNETYQWQFPDNNDIRGTDPKRFILVPTVLTAISCFQLSKIAYFPHLSKAVKILLTAVSRSDYNQKRVLLLLFPDSVAHIGEYSNKERSCFILSWLVFQPDSDIPN